MPPRNESERIVSYDDVATVVYNNALRGSWTTATDIIQQNNTFTTNTDDARIHSVSIDLDGDEALQEYYADIVNRFERNHPQFFTTQRWNVSPDVSFRLNKNEIKELIREVLIEEGIILNKPQKAIEAEEVDELFEQRGINEEC